MENMTNGILAPLLVSIAVAMGARFMNSHSDSAFLKENIQVTKELRETIVDLKVQLNVFGERYVTRDELNARLKEEK